MVGTQARGQIVQKQAIIHSQEIQGIAGTHLVRDDLAPRGKNDKCFNTLGEGRRGGTGAKL